MSLNKKAITVFKFPRVLQGSFGWLSSYRRARSSVCSFTCLYNWSIHTTLVTQMILHLSLVLEWVTCSLTCWPLPLCRDWMEPWRLWSARHLDRVIIKINLNNSDKKWGIIAEFITTGADLLLQSWWFQLLSFLLLPIRF